MKNTEYIVLAVHEELERAMAQHAPLNSAHEAYAVILEGLDEVWDEVRKKREDRDGRKLRRELIQVAAMACRAIHDLKLNAEERTSG